MTTKKIPEPHLADLELFSEISDEVQASVRGGFTITVRRGDTLSGLAKVYCEDSSKWPQIYNNKANKKKIGSNPNLIRPGQVLNIPCVTRRILKQI
ncbi:LysM peptidoglycan-binding domain-containing protein [Nostoc sp. CHAB 5784]|uniref:LysM peptidoglycan-binding domain-containing protein n=1 Tax=Nostoc mirabile TaxID=2907820 RepID=UPI001E59FDD2|nr:LysM peptidoglycan-binding domain-containing protein [Nostoc mirabile]MCC5668972.1 LysM peptidoglycan-binding domain-containing protein [Nostoc mirabile CHAB5784]